MGWARAEVEIELRLDATWTTSARWWASASMASGGMREGLATLLRLPMAVMGAQDGGDAESERDAGHADACQGVHFRRRRAVRASAFTRW